VASRTSQSTSTPDWEVLFTCLLLIFAVGFNLYHLYPEIAIKAALLNDNVLHVLSAESALAALQAGHDPTDFWLAPVSLGYPLFHHYQHLPHVLTAILYLPFRGVFALSDMLAWIGYLLLSLFPLSLYWSMRAFRFSRLTAALGGLVSPLLATDGLYGLDHSSYVWSGYGLYTQLWGMLLLPPVLGLGYKALRSGRYYIWAALLLAATVLSHLVLGYAAALSLLIFAFIPTLGRRERAAQGDTVRRRVKRLALLSGLVALVTAYFVVPFLLDRSYLNRSVWEERGKYDAYGHAWTLETLAKGDLFDFGRFPSLTLLAGVGLAVCAVKWKDEHYRMPAALFLVWLLLYFGRPTWGILIDILPLGRELHLHRLIAAVHLSGVYLAAIGLAPVWRWAMSGEKPVRLLAPALVTALVLFPAFRERGAYLRQNALWMTENRDAALAEEGDLTALIQALEQLPPGRVYAGLGGNWGADYKVGAVPMYALLNSARFDTLGYLYHALSLNADVQLLFDEGRWEHYNLFNVRYVVAQADRVFPDFVHPLRQFGRHALYEVETTGYFDLVDSSAAFAGNKGEFYAAASAWLASDSPSGKDHPRILLTRPATYGQELLPLGELGDHIERGLSPDQPPRGRIVAESIEGDAYSAGVEVERDSFLMLKATYHPNWRAFVDGHRVETVMLMPSYVGVKVSPGRHHVRLEYRPGPLRAVLQAGSVLVLVLAAVAERRRDRLARFYRRLSARLPRATLRQYWERLACSETVSAARQQIAPHLPYLGWLAILTLLAGLPLLQPKIMSGHDALAHLPRSVEFYQGLKAGQVFPRWAPDLSGGYGQPHFNFYPPLFSYVSSIPHALGLTFVVSQNVTCLALLYLAAVGMYFLAGGVYNPRGGLVAAVAYLFAPYLLMTLYVRHALADFAAFAFLPLVILGLYRYVQSGGWTTLLLGSASLALLLLSSNSVSLITFPALLLLLGGLAYRARSWRHLARGLWCLSISLGLAAFFWLPALVERSFVHISRATEGYLSYELHFLYLHQLVWSRWGYGLSLPGPRDEMSFAIGPLHLVLVCVALVSAWRGRRASRRAQPWPWFFLLVIAFAAFFASQESVLLWDWLPLLHYLQFPWRFLSLIALATAFLSGFPLLLISQRNPRGARVATGVLLAGFLLTGLPHARPQSYLDVSDADYSPAEIAAKDISATTSREYEPVWVVERPQTPAETPLTLLEGEGRILGARLTPTFYEFHAQISEEALLQLNCFYFPGWEIYVDGAEVPVEVDNPQGLMQFTVEPGDRLVQASLRGTPIRAWSKRISLVALSLLILTPWMSRTRDLRKGEVARVTGDDA
jgi:hypothetical protein